MTSAATDDHGHHPVLYATLAVFAVKAFLLAFFFIPLADVSDEPGHYSYVLDIAEGRGLPVIGETPIDDEIRALWLKGDLKDSYRKNYIAQHPPLYYAVNAVLVKLAGFAIRDPASKWKFARLLSVISAVLLLFVFYHCLLLVTRNHDFALFSTAFVSFVPMFGWQSAGVSNDMFVALLGVCATWFWLRLLKSGEQRHGLMMAVMLSLAALTKLTSLLLLLPMVASALVLLDEKRVGKRLRKFTGIVAVAMVGPVLWMGWCFSHYGSLLATWHSVVQPAPEGFEPDISVIGLLTMTRVVEAIFSSFFGHFGWLGNGEKVLRVFLIESRPFMSLYFVLGSVVAGGAVVTYHRWERQMSRSGVPFISILALVVFAAFIYWGIPAQPYWPGTPVLYALLLSLAVFSLRAPLIGAGDLGAAHVGSQSFQLGSREWSLARRAATWSLFLLVAYTLVFVVKLRDLYAQFGVLYGPHGRYWFSTMGLLFLGMVYPAHRTLRPSSALLALIIALAAINETLLYVLFVFPKLGS